VSNHASGSEERRAETRGEAAAARRAGMPRVMPKRYSAVCRSNKVVER